ncbi:DNA mismatch repair protein MutT [Endozoicomonas montiporae]|uniref:DNA mismatch repair protein MutT n=1 Tax=Endozoicomonas montiporae TaxID=1027273 RepID=A0A081N0T5_9GAMM|nr:NUDIX hydrolase [Endozoicomonas montiporae]KEQ12058.1 DNA mismatch repair protein MutT [Endozoicomonas montiporae]
MNILRTAQHPDITDLTGSILHRKAARGIILQDNNILLMYTRRYHDYSLPGGGIDDGESLKQGLIRELEEETGARNIRNIEPMGVYEEYRPWYKPEHDIMHMLSYCYFCTIDAELDAPRFEDYEMANGMEVVWINIHEAIEHNKTIIAGSDKKGLSIDRETWLLEKIVELRGGALSD